MRQNRVPADEWLDYFIESLEGPPKNTALRAQRNNPRLTYADVVEEVKDTFASIRDENTALLDIGDSNSYGSAPSGHSRTTEKVTQSSEMHCWYRSSDKPSLAILLFFMVMSRGLLHMKGQTLKIIFHPSKRKSDEK